MKVIDIKPEKCDKYTLSLQPNWLEKLFGCKPKTVTLKDTGNTYLVGGGSVYIDKNGSKSGDAANYGGYIDKWRRSKNF